MHPAEVTRAVAAATSIAASCDLVVDDAVVLHNSNKLSVRLLPYDVVARVAPVAQRRGAQFEVGLAPRLAAAGCPVAALEPRVEPRAYEHAGFVVTFWTHYRAVTAPEAIPPTHYADALRRLHAGMRGLDVAAPPATDRVDSAARLVADRVQAPGLADADRELLIDTLRRGRRAISGRAGQQLLHGEPHPGNLLATADGLVFIDLETGCRGPVEFDLAHAPEDVAEHYPGIDRELLRECRTLMLAMIVAWRWEPEDQLPDGHRLGAEWLEQLRATVGHG